LDDPYESDEEEFSLRPDSLLLLKEELLLSLLDDPYVFDDEFSLEFSLRPDDPYESLFEEELLFDEPYELDSVEDELSLRPDP
jgi:hypothetical protein